MGLQSTHQRGIDGLIAAPFHIAPDSKQEGKRTTAPALVHGGYLVRRPVLGPYLASPLVRSQPPCRTRRYVSAVQAGALRLPAIQVPIYLVVYFSCIASFSVTPRGRGP